MGEPSLVMPPSEKLPEVRLDSWKEIAAYLKRDVTTVQRWEKREGMPVHRHLHEKRGSVYALAEELDAWIQSRKPTIDEPETSSEAEMPQAVPIGPETMAPRRARRWLALAAILCVCLAASAWLVFRHRATEIAPPRIRSIAVLPLRNLSGDPAQEYLADGITEALIGRLANIHDLHVTSHTSVMRFKEYTDLHTGDRQNSRRGCCRRRVGHKGGRPHSRHGPADSGRNGRAFLVRNL